MFYIRVCLTHNADTDKLFMFVSFFATPSALHLFSANVGFTILLDHIITQKLQGDDLTRP